MIVKMPTPKQPAPKPSDEIEEDGHELRMTLLDHLRELRTRFTRAFIALIAGTFLGFLVTEPAFNFLLEPYRRAVPEAEAKLRLLAPTDSIVSFLRVSLLLGAIIAIPIITYQLLMFIVPGLTKRERRMVLSALPMVTLLFLVGVAFSWYILIPPALDFLANFQRSIFEPEWTADLYLGFVTSLLFWMGVAFQTPLIFFILSLMGITSPGGLAKQWRLAIVLSTVAAAIITPTVDPVNLFLVMGPLLSLYFVSILLSIIGYRRFARAGETTT